MREIAGKVIVVAGASRGIGYATCRLLAAHGATVVAVSRSECPLDKIRSASPESTWIGADLRSPGAWEFLTSEVLRRFERLDVLVNSQGVLIPGALAGLSADDVENMIATNLGSVAQGVRAAVPCMKRQGRGHIIVIGSLGGLVPMPFEAIYCATKYAVRGLCLSLHHELREAGIHVSLLSPGPVETPMLRREAEDVRSTMSFLEPPMAPERVAREVLRLIRWPRREVLVPAVTGRLSMLGCAVPALFDLMYPLLDQIGGLGLARFRREQPAAAARATPRQEGVP